MLKVDICNIKIDNLSMQGALKEIEHLIKGEGQRAFVVTPNVDHLVKLQKDMDFKRVYDAASLVLADGMPLIWASKFLGTPLKEKISGSDLFPKLCELAQKREYSLFFLGGRPGAAQKAAEKLRAIYKKIQIVGIYSPPFGFENDKIENDKIVSMIKNARPDILFVGLGAPKQEKWIYKHYEELNIPVSIGIGVTFEFFAGFVKRAPLWMQKAGCEWLWRLMEEPERLWKRYLIDDMKFFWLILRQKYKQAN
jgi:N-acetylglucosaminyldiphosphoundecaprenol N-acetyl-beta-D-mannosaminyltransferase